MSIERRGATNNQRDTARLEAFSDGVFAIAITLLVLNIHVPDGNVQDSLLKALGDQWSTFLGYITSFIVIGIIWTNHHHMYTYIRRTDRVSLILNVFALLFVAFIPFPTALIARYIATTDNARIALMIYSGTLLVVTLLYNILWWYATTNVRLVDKDVDPEVLQSIKRSYLIGVPLYFLSFLLAFVNPYASLAVYVLVAILYVLFAGNIPILKSFMRSRRLEDELSSEE